MEWTKRRTWSLVFGAASKKLELLAVLLSLLLLLATTATAYEAALLLVSPVPLSASDAVFTCPLQNPDQPVDWTQQTYLEDHPGDNGFFGWQPQSFATSDTTISAGHTLYKLLSVNAPLGHDTASSMEHLPFVLFQAALLLDSPVPLSASDAVFTCPLQNPDQPVDWTQQTYLEDHPGDNGLFGWQPQSFATSDTTISAGHTLYKLLPVNAPLGHDTASAMEHLPFLLFQIEESSSSESTEEYEQTDSYPPVEQGRASTSDICEEEVQKWMCIDLVNSDSAVVAGPRVTDFPTSPDVKFEKLTQTIARVTHVYSEGYELMVPPNATIQVSCSQVRIRSPTFNCSHDYLMINSERYCNNKFPQAPFTFTSGNPGSQESMIVLKTANPQQASYSCQLQVIKRHPKRIIDLIKHVEFTLDVSGMTHREETDFVILAPKKSFVVMSCPVFEVSDYWPCRQSYITVELQRYCHFPTAHKVEIEIPPTSTASINVRLASSPNDRVRCVLHRIAGKKTACVDSPNTPTYVGAPEQQAQICVNMVASPIVKIVSPFRDDMETEMDMTVRYEVMSVPHMVHYLWCNDFRLDTDCSKERLHWFNYNDRLCGHSRPRDFTYSYGSVVDKATYSLTYKKRRGVRQGRFSCFLYREPQTKGTYTLDLFSKNSATIEKHPSRRMFPHDSQVITYYVLAPPDSEVIVTCSAFNIQSGQDCSNSYLKINDRQYCDSNVPGRLRLELTYNYAAVVFRDGKDASNSFSCTFERGSSTDKCAFERKHPVTTISPFETIPTSEFPLTTTENPLFPAEGVTTMPAATTLFTPLTEETPGPWFTFGSTTLQALRPSPNVTPEQGATVPFKQLPGETTEYPTEFSLLPQHETTRPSPPAGLFVPTTEAEAPPMTPSGSTGIIPAITGSASPPEFGTGLTPLFPQENPTVTFPPGASISPPTGISQLTGIPALPTTQIPFPSQVSRLPTSFVPTLSVGVSVPRTVNGTPPSAALQESTPTFPSGMTFIPTREVPIPLSIPSQPTVLPSVSPGASQPETGTPGLSSFPQIEVTATLPSGHTFAPTTEVSLPPGVPGQPSVIIPALSPGVSVPETATASSPSVSVGVSLPETRTASSPPFPEEGTGTFPSGVSVAATTEIQLPSNIPGKPSAVVPSVSVGVSVPETFTATPPSLPQEETQGFPTGVSIGATTEVSLSTNIPGQPTAVVPSMSVGVSVPETGSAPPSFPPEGTETFPSGVPIGATTEVSLPSNVPGQPTAVVPSMSVGVSVQETASPTPPFPPEGTETLPSGVSIGATTEVSLPSNIPGQPTAIVPSMSVGVSVPKTGSPPPSFPPEGTETFPSGVSIGATTEVSLPTNVPGQPTAVVPSMSVGVSVPETGSPPPPFLPEGTETLPSGVSIGATTEVSLPSNIPGQPTAIVPSMSVGVSVPETGSPPPPFPPEGTETFPSGVSIGATTEVSLPSNVPGQPTAVVPSMSAGVSVPETGSAPPSFPPEGTETFPSGVSIGATTEVSLPSNVPGQPTAVVPSMSVGVSVPETGSAPPSSPPEGTETFPSGVSIGATTEVSLPSNIPSQPTAVVPSMSVGVSVPEAGSPPPSFPPEGTETFPSGVSIGATTEVSLPSNVPGQPTAVVPSMSVGVSVPETGSPPPPFPPEGTETLPSGVSIGATTEVSLPSNIPGQPTAIVPSMSVGVSVPKTGSPPPSFPPEGTETFPSGVSIGATTEVSLPTNVPGQPTAVVPSMSVGVSVPETGSPPPPFLPEGTETLPSGVSIGATTEVSLPSNIPGQPTAVVPSISVGVSVPETGSPTPPFPPEGTETLPSGVSIGATTEVSLPSNVPGQPTAVVPSMSVGVSVPETASPTPPFPPEGTETFPSGVSIGATTEVSLPSNIPGQPTAVVPSMSVGVSVPETGSAPLSSPPEGTETFPSGVSIGATTEVSLPSNIPGQPTAVVPSMSVGVSVPETGSPPPPFPPEGTETFPSGVSIGATTEVSLPSNIPGQPTAVVPSMSVGVSVPETGSPPPPFPPEGTETFPSGVSIGATTEVSLPSNVPGQPTAVVPSMSAGVSVPETGSAPPSFPPEGTETFPSGVSIGATTEVSLPSNIPGHPAAVVPSVSVGVSVPVSRSPTPPSSPEEGTDTFPSGVSIVSTTEVSLPSGAPAKPTAVVPSIPVGVSVPGTATASPPSLPQVGITGSFPSGVSGGPTTEVPLPPGITGQPALLIPPVSVGVSVPETATASPPSFAQEGTGTLPSGASVVPTTEMPSPSGGQGPSTTAVPSLSVGVSVPETITANPYFPPQEGITGTFSSGASILPTTEVPAPSGVPRRPSVVPSVSVAVSAPETATASPSYFPQEESTGTLPYGVSLFPTTEQPVPAGAPSKPTGLVPPVTIGVSLPEGESTTPPPFSQGEMTGTFPAEAFGSTTEVPLHSGVPWQPTNFPSESVSVGVSGPGTVTAGSTFLPKEQTASFHPGISGYPTTELSLPTSIPGQPTFPQGGVNGSFPSGGSVVPATEVSLPPSIPELVGSVVPSVSVGSSVPQTGATSPSTVPQEETGTHPSPATMIPGTDVSLPSSFSGEPTSVVPSAPFGSAEPESATTKPSPFRQGESLGTLPPGVSVIRTTEASVPSGVPGETTNAIPSYSVLGSEPGTVTGGSSFPGGWFPTTITSGASGMTVPPGVSDMFSTEASAIPSPGESLPPGGTPTYPSAFSVIPTTEVSLASGKPGQPGVFPSVSVDVSEPLTAPASPATRPQGEEPTATFPSGVSAQPTTEVPAVTLGVSIPEIATGTPLPRTVETRTLPGGFPVSETVPTSPVLFPELSTPAYPHYITGEPKTGSPFMPGIPPLSSGVMTTVSGAVGAETKPETGPYSLDLHEATTQPSIFSVMPNTEIQSPSRPPFTPATEVPGASMPFRPFPSEGAVSTPSFSGTKVSNVATSTPRPAHAIGVTTSQEVLSTTFPPSLISPETDEIRILLMIIRTDLKTFKVNATVLHVFLIKATTVGTHEAYSIILLALKDLKSSCKYLAPSERIKVAYEVAHYLKSHGTRIAHHVVVSAVGVFLCAVDHKDIITKLLSENTYMISISESVASELSCPDMEHLVHLLYADRNRTKVEESPCAGILCEEVPENVMDTIDMLVDRYFPQKAHEKKWLMLDIAKALNLQPEEDEDGDEMVYYKMGDYDVFLEELREPTISDEERALLFGKYFAEVRKVAKAERKLRLDDLEEVWKMGGGKLPQPAVRSFIALLKLVHSKRISLNTEERIRLLKLALKCDGHECQKLSSSDIHNLIFALCNVGIRDGFGLPKDLKSQVTKFILTLKDNYIDSISIRRWKRTSSLLKPKSHDYLSASSPSELRYLKDWLQKPMSFIEKKPLLKNTGRSNDDPSGNGPPVLSQLYSAYVSEKRPDIKTVLAERLLDTYNSSFKHLGSAIGDTEKFVLSVVQQLPSTTARHNDLVLGILKQCIEHGDPCLNITRNEHVAPVKVILQNMSLKQSPNFVPELSHDLFAAAKKQRTDVDLSWLTDSSAVNKISQSAAPPTLQMPSRAS